MTTPPYRPPPDTSHLDEDTPEGMHEAARSRNQWRNIMAIRWRDKTAREEDQKLGRLPEKWHDWMRCPAPEGYQTRGCTCDSWYEKRKPKRYKAPVLHHKPDPACRQTRSPARPHINRLVIKTIDLRFGVPILLEHADSMQTTMATHPARGITRAPRARSGLLCRFKPVWLRGRRCVVPRVRSSRRRA